MTRIKIGLFCLVCMCIAAISYAEVGVTDAEILIGQSCALEGPAAGLGLELKAGAEAYINQVNREGGVNGRKIKLISYNDGYEPDTCIDNTRKLIDDDKVFLLFGYVGTPTASAAIPIIDEVGIPFVGPFTGAGFLRDPQRKVFNIRGTYDQETGKLVKSFHRDMGFTKIACLYQNDAYGKAGLSGVEKGLEAEGLTLAGSATYERNTVAVKGAVATMKKIDPDAIIMVGAYKPCAAFIKLAKQIGINAKFANISFVGTANLIEEMGAAGEGTYISQVMPSPADTSIPVVRECTDLLGRQPMYGELEGFVDAKVLVKGLDNAGANVTRAAFIGAMEDLSRYDAGGVIVSYGPGDHQGIDEVFLTKVIGGKPIPVEKLQ
ncbi:MAG: ABC transporter substrate-binding protein [Candidatus Omnitrophica bacterium]|nr:ABC transporter substrate-binding protein [Candidatus Omnitrophota bacterium]